jgi:hypothetical protein
MSTWTPAQQEVATTLESLHVLAGGGHGFTTTTPHRLRGARICYDHIAGTLGVLLTMRSRQTGGCRRRLAPTAGCELTRQEVLRSNQMAWTWRRLASSVVDSHSRAWTRASDARTSEAPSRPPCSQSRCNPNESLRMWIAVLQDRTHRETRASDTIRGCRVNQPASHCLCYEAPGA